MKETDAIASTGWKSFVTEGNKRSRYYRKTSTGCKTIVIEGNQSHRESRSLLKEIRSVVVVVKLIKQTMGYFKHTSFHLYCCFHVTLLAGKIL